MLITHVFSSSLLDFLAEVKDLSILIYFVKNDILVGMRTA